MGLEGDHLFITNTVVPGLLEAGITREQVDEMMVANSVRYFSV